MRVYCKVCGQRGRITKTNRLSDDVSDLYCQCTDAECGHSWGGHLVVRPYPKPLGQNHQPVGTQLDGVTNAGGAGDDIERIRKQLILMEWSTIISVLKYHYCSLLHEYL